MTLEERLIDAIERNTRAIYELKMVVVNRDIDWIETEEACRITKRKNPRDMKFLRDLGHFKAGEFKRVGKPFYYKRTAVYRVADKIFGGEIIMPTISRNKSSYENN